MNERQQLPHRSGRAARARSRAVAIPGVRHRETLPTEPPPLLAPPEESTLFGLPAEVPEDTTGTAAAATDAAPAAEVGEGLLVFRRSDSVAGSLLLVAGAAGGMSLFLPWVEHDGELGLTLVQRALGIGEAGVEEVVRGGFVLPVGVAVGGGLLFLLGLLAFRPARTHRATGLAALIASLAVAAGVVVRVSDAGWEALQSDPGVVCAVVLATFGVLGALKAMLTAPAVTAGTG